VSGSPRRGPPDATRRRRPVTDALALVRRSENTAGVHVSNVLGKLSVTGRGEAAAVAYRLGLVEPARELA